MLAQRAERDELDAAVRFGALIYLLVVARALQVLIEAVKRLERGVAQEALVLHPIPRALRRPRRSTHRRLVLARRPTEQPRGVRDVVLLVRPHDESVELLARHARPARARLKVERERRGRDKRLVALAAGAHDVARPVQLGVQVLLEAVLVLKNPLALGAVVVHLVVMFLEFRIAVKELVTVPARMVILDRVIP